MSPGMSAIVEVEVKTGSCTLVAPENSSGRAERNAALLHWEGFGGSPLGRSSSCSPEAVRYLLALAAAAGEGEKRLATRSLQPPLKMRRSFGEGEEGSADATAETARAGVEETSGPRAGFARRAIVGDLHLQEGHSGPLRQMSIGKLGDADSRLIRRDPIFTRSTSVHTAIAAQIISVLLKPRTWKPPPAGEIFEFSPHELVELCEHAEAVLREEPTLLKLSAPIKIFGDIHGQYPDLMRLFSEFGAPSHTGDLDLVDYLFLGDFVDRGTYQLETICLILALKIEYRDRVFVIRGNHESPEINEKYGFRDECIERLGPAGDAVWRCFNAVFAWMPLAATIGGKIFCVHGGIGLTVESLEQVAAIERPIQKGEGPLMMDLLWSDPAAHDSVTGISLNLQRLGPDRTPDRAPMPGECTTFDAARVNDFCRHNGIHLIIRAHECVMDGFERCASRIYARACALVANCLCLRVLVSRAPLAESAVSRADRQSGAPTRQSGRTRARSCLPLTVMSSSACWPHPLRARRQVRVGPFGDRLLRVALLQHL